MWLIPGACEIYPVSQKLTMAEIKSLPLPSTLRAKYRMCGSRYSTSGIQEYILSEAQENEGGWCIFYEVWIDRTPAGSMTVDHVTPSIARMENKVKCPRVDFSSKGYPGKAWTFIHNGIPLEDAKKIKSEVESNGIKFLNAENEARQNPSPIYKVGNSTLYIPSILRREKKYCEKTEPKFNELYDSCYKVIVRNVDLIGAYVYVAGSKSGTYSILYSGRTID